MPVISMFYGIIVRMFYLDNKQHNSPHIHVEYQDYAAVIQIPEGILIEGKFPPAKLKLVLAWVEIHRDELVADWKLAIQGQPVFKIEALK
jgi:hypothetical protein